MNGSPVEWMSDAQYASAAAIERALAWGDSQMGLREVPRDSNRGECEKYLRCAGAGVPNPYCASGIYWCLIQAGVSPRDLPARGAAASVRGWVEWAERLDLLVDSPRRGTLFFWLNLPSRKGHIGFCTGGAVGGSFSTMQFNTSPSVGEERNGGGNYKKPMRVKKSHRKCRYGFIDLTRLKVAA